MKEQLADIKENLQSKDTLDTLKYLVQSGLKCAFSSSFGQEDQVLTHIIAREKLPIDIFTLDTGRLFPQTYELIDQTTKRLKINIKVIFPTAEKMTELVENQGVNGFYHSIENRKACCSIRKIEPLKKALQGVDVWITGLRSGQSENRKELSVITWDENFHLLKVNPLINWKYDQVIEHLHTHKVPYNPLHDKGFKSIGCAPCTRAIDEGEDDRAGRWWWESSKKECGLHQHK